MTPHPLPGYNPLSPPLPQAARGEIAIEERFQEIVGGAARGVLPSLARLGLRLASVPYGVAVALRNRRYDRGSGVRRAAVPVVSVGNLTVGGTGKTPCVEAVARFYRDRGLRVAILSRGYGSDAGPNDEALALEETLPDVPHLQGADRFDLAVAAVEELESEILVLDDGFQHRRLARDLDIVLVDATNPWGHGYLLPRGLLRESPRGLRRAGVVVLTRVDQAEPEALARLRGEVAVRAPNAVVAEAVHRPGALVNADKRESVETLRGRRIGAFCGVGRPEAFRRTLLDVGAEVVAFRRYADHHAYARADVEELRTWARQLPEGSWVVTTLKDLVKLRLPDLAGSPLWALRVELELTAGREAFESRLAAALGAAR